MPFTVPWRHVDIWGNALVSLGEPFLQADGGDVTGATYHRGVGHEYPERAGRVLPMLSPAHEVPPEPHQRAQRITAEVLQSDQTWMPVTVLAWHRLNKPLVQPLTNHRIAWLVELRLADGSEGWYQHVAGNLRQT
jgi:hypothetical protein